MLINGGMAPETQSTSSPNRNLEATPRFSPARVSAPIMDVVRNEAPEKREVVNAFISSDKKDPPFSEDDWLPM